MTGYDSAEGLLDGLTASQRVAVVSDAAPLCILASAGAGKTRVLTRRIAYRILTGTATAPHTVALTFTRKAAGEMQTRLSGLGMRERVAAGTFHSIAAAQLQRWWADRREDPPTLLERKSRILGPISASRPGLAGIPLAELAGHIEWAKARLITPDRFEAAVPVEKRQLPAGVTAAAMASLYGRYEDEKTRRRLIDFDDLLDRCATAIEIDPAFAGAQRWRWRHVYVDEFQDLNPLQHRLLLAWMGSSTDLCVVGDPNQAIYGWNGADPTLLAGMEKRWPSTQTVRLDANHRCSPQIVAAASSVLGPEGASLRSAGADGPWPDVRSYSSEETEARGIAAGVLEAHSQGSPWSSLAVLARTNAQLVPIHRALSAVGVPTWTPSQSALLEDPYARQVLAQLRAAPSKEIQVVIADLEEMVGEVLGDEDAAATLTALGELARSFASQEPGAPTARWLAWLPSAMGSDDRAGPSDQVTLCSFHRAKGLEWSTVWVAGLETGLVPIGRSRQPAQESEERRLLYVAMTRAAVRLHCSWARQRTFGTRAVPRTPSPWLELIEAAGDDSAHPRPDSRDTPPPTAITWRSRLAEQKQQLRVATPTSKAFKARLVPPGWPEPDADLVRTLRTWRTETARSSGVPAYVILHDATVDALAALRPQTVEELLSVPGLGPVKADRYGPSLLSLVADRARSA